MLKKIEAYFMKEIADKAGLIAILSLLLFIPNFYGRVIFLLLLICLMLPFDIHNKRFSLLISLPFSHREIFLSGFVFVLAVSISTQFIGGALLGVKIAYLMVECLKSVIFCAFYYGVSMMAVLYGLDNLGIPLLVFFADTIFGAIGPKWSNFYSYISPVHNGNLLFSAVFAAVVFVFSFYLFERKGIQK